MAPSGTTGEGRSYFACTTCNRISWHPEDARQRYCAHCREFEEDKQPQAGASSALDLLRSSHLAWCRRRALEYLDAGDLLQALASMISDLQKCPEALTTGDVFCATAGVFAYFEGEASMRRWIETFT